MTPNRSDPTTTSPAPSNEVAKPGRTELGNALVSDHMATPVVALREQDTVWTAMERFVVAGLRHLVVVAPNGRCAGILTNHHIASLWPLDPLGLHHRLVEDLLQPGTPPTVGAATRMADAARLMVAHSTDALAVVDSDGLVIGVLTGGDIVALVAQFAD